MRASQPQLQTGLCRPYNPCTALQEETGYMPRQQQRTEALERENERLKNELLSANEQIAQLKILIESHAQQIRQLKERKILDRC
jgi:hypothetical protein